MSDLTLTLHRRVISVEGILHPVYYMGAIESDLRMSEFGPELQSCSCRVAEIVRFVSVLLSVLKVNFWIACIRQTNHTSTLSPVNTFIMLWCQTYQGAVTVCLFPEFILWLVMCTRERQKINVREKNTHCMIMGVVEMYAANAIHVSSIRLH